jgi:putative membrane protein
LGFSGLSNLVTCLTSFEKILRTPIPLAYSVHLYHMTWLYLMALPFQLVAQLGWWTILVVGIAAFSLIGILAVGQEIENPFGYDPNDLVK